MSTFCLCLAFQKKDQDQQQMRQKKFHDKDSEVTVTDLWMTWWKGEVHNWWVEHHNPATHPFQLLLFLLLFPNLGEFEAGQNELNQFYQNRNSRNYFCPSCLLTDSKSLVGSKGRFWGTLTAFYFGRFSILQPKTGSTPSHKSWLRPFWPIVNFASKRSQVRLFSTDNVVSSFPRNVVVIFVEGANSVIPGVYLKKGESPQHKIVLM